MIVVKYAIGKRDSVEIRGHAGCGKKGEDVVCAFVSGVAAVMKEAIGAETYDEGLLMISCKNNSVNESVIRAGITALYKLAEAMPDVIEVREVRA